MWSENGASRLKHIQREPLTPNSPLPPPLLLFSSLFKQDLQDIINGFFWITWGWKMGSGRFKIQIISRDKSFGCQSPKLGKKIARHVQSHKLRILLSETWDEEWSSYGSETGKYSCPKPNVQTRKWISATDDMTPWHSVFVLNSGYFCYD